jgi:hypothetical protein
MNEKIIISELGKVGVLYGGRSAEREVSLMSGSGVLKALKDKGVDAHGFDTGEKGLAELAAQKFDRVFIALHGRYGEVGNRHGQDHDQAGLAQPRLADAALQGAGRKSHHAGRAADRAG